MSDKQQTPKENMENNTTNKPEENTENQQQNKPRENHAIKPAAPETVTKQASQFVKWFWGTIIALFVITLAMLLLSMLGTSDKNLSSVKNEVLMQENILKILQPMITQEFANLDKKSFSTDFQKAVEQSIDNAFEPVYKNIPAFADRYYSVTGQYATIALKVSDNISNTNKFAEEIQQILMPNLETNLQKASLELNHAFIQEVTNLTQTSITSKPDYNPAFTSLLAQEIENQLSDLKAASYVGIGFLGSFASIKLIASSIAGKFIAKIALKVGSKTGIKIVGVASGASVGAICGPAAPICGLVGAVLGWFGTDAAFTSIDEIINRDEFEQETKQHIDKYKEEVKANTLQRLNAIKDKIANMARQQIQGKTPSEL